jgi:hypothetical protein
MMSDMAIYHQLIDPQLSFRVADYSGTSGAYQNWTLTVSTTEDRGVTAVSFDSS